MSTLLRAGRVHELMSLIGSCGELTLEQRRRHLVEGIVRLVGARAAIAVDVNDYTCHGQSHVEGVVSSGFDGIYGERFIASVASSACEGPIVTIGAGLGDGAYRRRDILDDRTWYATRWVSEDFLKADVDDGVYARIALEGQKTECIGAFRPPGARPFTTEERALMNLLSQQLPRLLRPRPQPRLAKAKLALSPRVAQTLERLCQGQSEKQVAMALGISRHTVHTYVKSLYERFGVMSRAELLARFIDGATPPSNT